MTNELEENRSNRKLWDDLYDGFNNSICEKCYRQKPNDKTKSFPQPIPYIGPKFFDDKYRLIFVGIETWSNKKRDSLDILDYTSFDKENTAEKAKEAFYNWRSPFGTWVRKISQDIVAKDKIIPSEKIKYAFESIAWTNLLKCQCRTGKNLDSSTYEFDNTVATNCIKEAKWIYHEIEEIGAKNIVVFSGRAHEYALARIFLKLSIDEFNKFEKFDYTKYDDLPIEKVKKRENRDFLIHLKDTNRRFIVSNHPQGTSIKIREKIIEIINNDLTSPTHWEMPYKK